MIESILDVTRCSTWLEIQTVAGQTALSEHLSSWTADPAELSHRSESMSRWKAALSTDPTFSNTLQQHFTELAEVEQQLLPLMKKDSKLEEESYNEILFFKPYLKPLNFIPFALMLWSVIRVYILPGLSLLLPIITLLAPYLIIRFIFHLPMNLSNYMHILNMMISGNMQDAMNPAAATTSHPPGALLKQVGVAAMTFLQGILQPYWTHQHLHSVDSIVQEHGRIVLRLRDLYQTIEAVLQTHGFTLFRCPLPPMPTEREATARLLFQPSYFQLALKYLGALEVKFRLARQSDVHPVRWISSPTPVFRIRDTFDFEVPVQTRKTLSARFDTQRHALLTGPNKGGKSTVLRALSTSALFAHTYGCAMGHLTATPFHDLFVCLKPDDLPGSKSRFEREIEFTAKTLKPTVPVLVFIDELYHSTNPPDALRSCHIYCEPLWKKTNVVSVISTHLFDFVEKADKNVQRLCCPAVRSNQSIEFLYSLEKGICTVSSVDSLLQKNGMVIP